MTRHVLHGAVLFGVLLAHAAVAAAQVAVLRIDAEAEAVCRNVEAALQGLGVVPEPGYLQQAREQGMDPTSDSALELITPLLRLRLAVVPLYADDHVVQIDYRDGRTGARLGKADIRLEQGVIGPLGREQLRREALAHLGTTFQSAPTPARQPPPLNGEVLVPAPAPALVLEPTTSDATRSLRASVHAGIGLGMRDVEWSLDGEAQRVAMGAFPAFELGAALAFQLGESIALVPAVAYQSSLAFHEVEEARTAAPSEKVGVRAHRFAGVLGLEARLGDGRSASITPAFGVGVRNLRPEVHHLSTPAYSLVGPLFQLGVQVPMGDAFSIRVVPEAQYLFVGEGLRERSVEDTGLELGAELALAIDVMDPLTLELAYREAHALLSSADGDAGDVERFATFRAVGRL